MGSTSRAAPLTCYTRVRTLVFWNCDKASHLPAEVKFLSEVLQDRLGFDFWIFNGVRKQESHQARCMANTLSGSATDGPALWLVYCVGNRMDYCKASLNFVVAQLLSLDIPSEHPDIVKIFDIPGCTEDIMQAIDPVLDFIGANDGVTLRATAPRKSTLKAIKKKRRPCQHRLTLTNELAKAFEAFSRLSWKGKDKVPFSIIDLIRELQASAEPAAIFATTPKSLVSRQGQMLISPLIDFDQLSALPQQGFGAPPALIGPINGHSYKQLVLFTATFDNDDWWFEQSMGHLRDTLDLYYHAELTDCRMPNDDGA